MTAGQRQTVAPKFAQIHPEPDIKRNTLLTLVLVAASTAHAASLYSETEAVTPADYSHDPVWQRFAKICGDDAVITTDIATLKTGRPQIDAQINRDIPTPEAIKQTLLDSIEDAEHDDCAALRHASWSVRPAYYGRHNQVEQFTVTTVQDFGGVHPVSEKNWYLFDDNGQRLTLADLLQGDKSALYPLLDAADKAATGSDPADKNSETYDEAYLESLHHDTDNIHFSADGLVITYPATAVISFGLAGGENTRVLPYAQLRGIIKDAYLPQ